MPKGASGAVVTKPLGVKPAADVAPGADLIEEDLLVEDVSIDGMCGVY